MRACCCQQQIDVRVGWRSGVPAWLYLRSAAVLVGGRRRGMGKDGRVVFFHLVVHPSCPYCSDISACVLLQFVGWCTWQLLLQVLVVLVAISIRCYESASLGITCALSDMPAFVLHPVLIIPMYCVRGIRVSVLGCRFGAMGGFVPASGGHIPTSLLAIVVVAGEVRASYTLSPILRRLRIVRSMVDIVGGRSCRKRCKVQCTSDVGDRAASKVARAP